MIDPASEEDNDQLTSTGSQQLLDSKELKKVCGISQSAYQPHVELQTKTYNKSHS